VTIISAYTDKKIESITLDKRSIVVKSLWDYKEQRKGKRPLL